MINVIDKSKCAGCHACYNVCPNQCIVMKKDKEGFLYPYINDTDCINCSLCEKICPFLDFER